MQKNQRIRKAMFLACMNQTELAALLETSDQEVSRMLNKYELAKHEQDKIIQRIRDYAASA